MPLKRLDIALSKLSDPFYPRASRKMDSNRQLWRGFRRPGSSGAKKLSIPNCFAIVLTTFGRLVWFHFFCLLAVRPNKQKAPNRHLPKQTDTCPNRQTPAQTDRHLQTDTCPKIIRKSSYVKVNFAIRAWLNSTSSCRELVPNGRLQRGPKINKKAYDKKGASEVSVCICHGPVQENGT